MDASTYHYAGLNTEQVHGHATALTVNARNLERSRTSTLTNRVEAIFLTDRAEAILSINSVQEYFLQINTYFTDAVKLELFDAALLLLKNSNALSKVIQEIIAGGNHLPNLLTLSVRYCAIIDACEAIVWGEILPAKQLQNSAAIKTGPNPNTEHEQPLL